MQLKNSVQATVPLGDLYRAPPLGVCVYFVFFTPRARTVFKRLKSLRADKIYRAEVWNEIITSSKVCSHISQDTKFHLFIFYSLELAQSRLKRLEVFQPIQWVLIQALNWALTLYIFDYWKDSNSLLPPSVLIQRPHFPLVHTRICHSTGNMQHFKLLQPASVLF